MTSRRAKKRRLPLTFPVSSVFRHAGGVLIPSAFFELRRGLFLERKRLRGRPWLVLLKRREIEYDGWGHDSVELTESFGHESRAVEAARDRLRAAFQEDGQPTFGDDEWQLVAQGPEVRAFAMPVREPGRMGPVYHYGYKLKRGDFNIRYGSAEVVRVNPGRVIDDELFDYLDTGSELVTYLCEKGAYFDRAKGAVDRVMSGERGVGKPV